MTERVFYYVPHFQVEERLRQGWIIAADLGPPHCFYAVLMEAPRKPKNKLVRLVESVLQRIKDGDTKISRIKGRTP